MITLGSILPDMLIGRDLNHYEAHSKGLELFKCAGQASAMQDFCRAVATHGFVPKGLDYYGDEKYLDFEKGYCFEKARALIDKTVDACNIPAEMGWWKAHNIIEMGVETVISATDYYSERIKTALYNRALISEIDEMLRTLWEKNNLNFAQRAEKFAGFVEIERATADSLAQKYLIQMQFKHQVRIDVQKVARLIDDAASIVTWDLTDFFDTAAALVKHNLAQHNIEGGCRG